MFDWIDTLMGVGHGFMEANRNLMLPVESALQWFWRGTPFWLPIVMMLLASQRRLGAVLGVERLIWNEGRWVQYVALLSIGMMYGVSCYVWYLFEYPKSLIDAMLASPYLPTLSLFPSSKNSELALLGRLLFLALMALGAITFGLKALQTVLQGGQMLPYLKARKYYTFGLLGYLSTPLLAWLLFLVDEQSGLRERLASLKQFQGMMERSDAFTTWMSHRFGGPLESVDPRYQQASQLHAVASCLAVLGAALFIASAITAAVKRKFTPGTTVLYFTPIASINLIIITVHTTFGYYTYHIHLPILTIVFIGGLLLFWNSAFVWRSARWHKLRFPDLDAEYQAPVQLAAPVNGPLKAAAAVPLTCPFLLDDESVLQKMCARLPLRTNGEKPRIVLIATSGGGIRAALWTGVVLEGLETSVPDLRSRTRIIAGASGGMVGALGYVGSDVSPAIGSPEPSDQEFGLTPLTGTLGAQSLFPLVQTMVVNDLLCTLLLPPCRLTYHDRGRSTQYQWALNAIKRGYAANKTPFDITFRDLHGKEESGQLPSLIFSPMLAEDCRRLLISNLDLQYMAEFQGSHLGQPPPNTSSRVAVEFFKLFPAAHNRFKAATAARMNASFPFFAPAVSLPTIPPRRPLDAGYFDNYGIDILARWLVHNQDIVRKYTSGVALVEIRAFPLACNASGFDPVWEPGRFDLVPVLGGALDPVATPLQAVVATRGAGVFYRNEQALQALRDVFNAGPTKNFFTNVAFELDNDASLNWYLSGVEKKDIVEQFFLLDPKTGLRTGLHPSTIARVRALQAWLI